jgi:RNA polymerase sigma factor (sigma-70 family)
MTNARRWELVLEVWPQVRGMIQIRNPESREDAEQACLLRLHQAMSRYSPARGSLCSYARTVLRSYLSDSPLDGLVPQVTANRWRIAHRLAAKGRTIEEIATAIERQPASVHALLALTMERHGAETVHAPATRAAEAIDAARLIRGALEHLSPGQRQVMVWLHGLDGAEPMSRTEIAKIRRCHAHNVSAMAHSAAHKIRRRTMAAYQEMNA